ncbi:hypothetical protein GCM10008015_18090 [Flavobacterium palustre]|uniref:CarboxypepD_reg-like domain-containing protein n=1 Tax=Flavobacterium palustre TaxID=1476463 RepID=A0ABQ1HIK0_9FLAO|nr:hypothetical protein [Flavobacterium palustre]GGA77822.1 hypothetical protein GCM10008015_18090 [Flavobacterium palustre]
MKVILPLLLFFLSQLCFGQSVDGKVIYGKIVVASGNFEGVTIVNLVNEKSTVSDSKGEFYILAKPEDLLVFSSVNLEIYRKLIEEEDLKLPILTIKMFDKITQLDEVVVNKHPEINAVSMGIIPKKVKHLTQMERQLYTAGDFKPIHLLGLLGGSLEIDPILNAINGRTKMIKKGIEAEKKTAILNHLEFLFEEEYYTNKLHIPKEYIKGFQYYCVEDEKNRIVFKSKNKTSIEFTMVKLAKEYNEVILCESEE